MKRIAFFITNIDFGGGEVITKTLARKFNENYNVEIISLCNALTTDIDGIVCKTILETVDSDLSSIVLDNKNKITNFLRNYEKKSIDFNVYDY